MKRRGITLIELMVALLISGMLASAMAYSFSTAVKIISSEGPDEEIRLDRLAVQDRIRDLLQSAYVSANEDDEDSFFIGQTNGDGTLQGGTYADVLIFTTLGRRVPGKALYNTEEDFETRNEELGPVGGLIEYSLATTAVGDAGEASGLFIRAQTPADTDPEQGGYESVLSSEITSIGFEFYDGTSWVNTWDTRTDEKRIPSAVRVVYTLEGTEQEFNFVVRLPGSDVTAANPLGSTGAAQ